MSMDTDVPDFNLFWSVLDNMEVDEVVDEELHDTLMQLDMLNPQQNLSSDTEHSLVPTEQTSLALQSSTVNPNNNSSLPEHESLDHQTNDNPQQQTNENQQDNTTVNEQQDNIADHEQQDNTIDHEQDNKTDHEQDNTTDHEQDNTTDHAQPENTEQAEAQQQNVSIQSEFNSEFMNMTESDIQEYIDGHQNKNTLKKTVRDVALIMRFFAVKNEHRELNQIPPAELDPLLANFLLTIRKKDGGEFEPSTLRSMISSVDRKLKRSKYGHQVLSSGTNDDVFQLTRDALKTKQRILKKQGKGNKPKRAQPITDEEINLLYDRKILGDSSPESLLYTIWLNNGVHFGLRGVQEHYTLRLVIQVNKIYSPFYKSYMK